MKKQKLFKMFRCIDVMDCFAVNRLVFNESLANKAQQLGEIQEKVGKEIDPEITRALKKYTVEKRLVETYTGLSKQYKAELERNPNDINTRSQMRQAEDYLDDHKDNLEDAEAELRVAIGEHSGAIEYAKKTHEMIKNRDKQLADLVVVAVTTQKAPEPAPTAKQRGAQKAVAGAPSEQTSAAAPKSGPSAPPAEPAKAPETTAENVTEKYDITMQYINNTRAGKSLTGDPASDTKVSPDNFKTLLEAWGVAKDETEDPATVVSAIKAKQGAINANQDGILGYETFSKLPENERKILTGGPEVKAEPVPAAPAEALPATPAVEAPPVIPAPEAQQPSAPAEADPDLSIFDKLNNNKDKFYRLTFSTRD